MDLLQKYCRKIETYAGKITKRRRHTLPMRNALKEMVGRLRSETDWTYRLIAVHLGISVIYAQKLEKHR